MKRKAMSKRERARRARIRRDPAGRVALTIADYLKGKGWGVVMTTGCRVEQFPSERNGKFRFVTEFLGTRPEKKATT